MNKIKVAMIKKGTKIELYSGVYFIEYDPADPVIFLGWTELPLIKSKKQQLKVKKWINFMATSHL